MTILDMSRTADAAADQFCIFREGRPDLISTGIGAVDRQIGGLWKGSGGILGAGTGVGKSRIVLAAGLANKEVTGIVSLEDTADVVGSRVLGWASGIDSRRIRIKDLTDLEIRSLSEAKARLQDVPLKVAYAIGKPLDYILEEIKRLVLDHGCRLIWIDYLQKIRGISDDRRSEVGTAFSRIQSLCDDLGAAVMFVCQFSRQPDPTRLPQIGWLKESGDLENEGRLICLFRKDPDNHRRVSGRIAKSTFGGEGTPVEYETDPSGSLREIDTRYEDEEF